MRFLKNNRGASTLEVIASLIIFALAAAGLAVALPMAFDRSDVWRGQMNLGRYLESRSEIIRNTSYDHLTVGNPGWQDDDPFRYQVDTEFVIQGTDNGNPSWIPVSAGGGDGISGTYYDNQDFSGYNVTRMDSNINFNWGRSQPMAGIGRDTFSVHWRGYIRTMNAGNYVFYANTSDGVRLWVNNQQIIDNWIFIKNKAQEVSGTIALNGNTLYPIQMDYFEVSKFATAQLRWSGPNLIKQIIPPGQFFSSVAKMSVVSVSDTEQTLSSRILTFQPQQSLPSPSPSPSVPPGYENIAVQMYNDHHRESTTNTLYPWIMLINNGTTPVNLSNISIRYYYTVESGQPQQYYCDWAGIHPTGRNLTGQVIGQLVGMASPKPNADHYLELKFAATAGSLNPQQSLELQVRIWNNDWSNYNQSNDYSFNPTAANYVNWAKVTAYADSILFWGTEP